MPIIHSKIWLQIAFYVSSSDIWQLYEYFLIKMQFHKKITSAMVNKYFVVKKYLLCFRDRADV